MFSKNKPPTPPDESSSGSKKNLNPMFGRYCRTQSFSTYSQAGSDQKIHMHYEISPADTQLKTWHVNLVHTYISKGRPTATQTFSKKKNCCFRDALEMVSDFENKCLADPQKYIPLFPNAAMMGYLHYKAFAEREGYIFDIAGTPFARSHPNSLPLDVQFKPEDIDSANRHIKRPENEFDGKGPSTKIPSTYFIFDQFNKAAHTQTSSERINEILTMRLFDTFVDDIQRAQDSMALYCHEYEELGKKHHIDRAERFLNHAFNIADQFSYAHIDPEPFKKFVLQAKVYCYALHAECLFKLIEREKVDFDFYKNLFTQSVNKALDVFRLLKPSEDEIELLKRMIVQRHKPVPSQAIQDFLDNYNKQKTAFDNKNGHGISEKKPPTSPTP